ncbi:MAG TPA: DUF4291 domain-containing protein [Cytophagaceae bacterium]|jgi:hypothetical protein|nr:DUF4291 domain-containing protein [Cytophagaceae bacterium]
MEEKKVRAVFDKNSITVYQAYNSAIANSAVQKQKFMSPLFKMERTTWIKPSFLWMMHRSWWATKENQENILAIKITREGWEWALEHSCLSHFSMVIHKTQTNWKTKLQDSTVKVQWDPEKDIQLNNLLYRSIQVGLTGIAVEKYINKWIIGIEDITPACKEIYRKVQTGDIKAAKSLLPDEKIYPLPENIRAIVSAS